MRTHQKFLGRIWNLHLTAIKDFYELAGDLYRERTQVRPQEKGVRAGNDPEKERMTGRFDHFGPGGTFQAHLVRDYGNEYGVEFVDIKQADANTHGIWRVLEFGLAPKMWGKTPTGLGSPGRHLMPRADPASPAIFMPISAARGENNDGPWEKRGPGLPPKLFLTDAIDVIGQDLEAGWERIADEIVRGR
jgi:hypothetical protein